jgi:ATP-binding cassette subfamily B protein
MIRLKTVCSLVWATIKSLLRCLRPNKVPVILQRGINGSADACIAMIVGYYDRKKSASVYRESVDIGRDGLTKSELVAVTRSLGLRGKSISLRNAREGAKLPAIVQCRNNQFVVIEGWTSKHVKIIDPSIGRRRMTMTEFEDICASDLLCLKPGARFAQTEAPNGVSWKYYLAYIWRNYIASTLLRPQVIIQILGLWLALQVLGLTLPLFTIIIVDTVIPFQISDIMLLLGVSMIFIICIHLGTMYLRVALMSYIQTRVYANLLMSLLRHLFSLPLRFFLSRTNGDLLMRAEIAWKLRDLLTTHILSVLIHGALVIGFLAYLLIKIPYFGLLVLSLGLTQIVLLLATAGLVNELSQSLYAAKAMTQSYLNETFAGIATLKASGGEQQAFSNWFILFNDQVKIELKRGFIGSVIDMVMTALRTLSPLVLLWVGAFQVLNGTTSVGTMLAQNALAISFLSWLTSMVGSLQQMQEIPTYVDRLADVLEEKPEQPASMPQIALKLSGYMEMRNVSFRYNATSPYILRDISFVIKPGQKVGVVGCSGAGKSTIIKLLLGIYSPSSGEIFYDSIPLEKLDYCSLRRQCGVVLQEAFMLNNTIKYNIIFNRQSDSANEVIKAARLAGIHEDIERMPNKYDTMVNEGGSGLSGGQRQRISLARALFHHPTVLFLDEATSHLDEPTEQIVDQNLDRLSCTRVIVAHRLSTVRNADLILVLKNGYLAEQGTHDDLVALGGDYAKLAGSATDVRLTQQIR